MSENGPGDTPTGGTSEDPTSGAAERALNRATSSGSKAGPTRRPSRRAPSSPSTPSGRDPQTLGAAVDRLIRDRGWSQESAAASLTTGWAQIVGPEIADHVRPESFQDGELLLRADSTAWATQVRLLMGTVRSAIDTAIGAGVVTSVVIRGPQGPTWKAGPRSVPGRGPRDTYG